MGFTLVRLRNGYIGHFAVVEEFHTDPSVALLVSTLAEADPPVALLVSKLAEADPSVALLPQDDDAGCIVN